VQFISIMAALQFISIQVLLSPALAAPCNIKNSQGSTIGSLITAEGSPANLPTDALFQLLTKTESCPQTLVDFKMLLSKSGLGSKAAMVANRGRNNPTQGSFSFFEAVIAAESPSLLQPEISIFFGHFTGLETHTSEMHSVVLDQEPTRGKLMIELIAWDPRKQFYNFYEMIGDGSTGQWFYRGDTADILADNSQLQLNSPGTQPQFGNRLRCSACHVSGGPIMKELAPPHNDWWSSDRLLPFGSNSLSPEVSNYLTDLVEASEFASWVKNGIDALEASPSYKKLKSKTSAKQLLRPLFCELEINLESSPSTIDELRSNKFHTDEFQIPSAFFVNPLLQVKLNIKIQQEKYSGLLRKYKLSFPETTLQDADHAWLTPVKSHSDLQAIQSLLVSGFVDEEFVTDVLAVDFINPLFSQDRCGLLQFVGTGPAWKAELLSNLQSSSLPSAKVLLNHMTNRQMDQAKHQQQISEFFGASNRLLQLDRPDENFKNLIRLRAKVGQSVISKNPRGQILEPGFRVIFPVGRAPLNF